MKNNQPFTPKEIRNPFEKGGRWDKPQQGGHGLCAGQSRHPSSERCLRLSPFLSEKSKPVPCLSLGARQFKDQVLSLEPISGQTFPATTFTGKECYKTRQRDPKVFGRKILSLFYWVAVFFEEACSGRTFQSVI